MVAHKLGRQSNRETWALGSVGFEALPNDRDDPKDGRSFPWQELVEASGEER